MNILLWILQTLLALHTLTGAVWKFSNSEQSVPTLAAIPHQAWTIIAVVEIFVALDLVLPFFVKPLGMLVPIAAGLIALEMLAFSGIHLASGAKEHGPMIYWLVVAGFAAFIVYGRLVLSPLGSAG